MNYRKTLTSILLMSSLIFPGDIETKFLRYAELGFDRYEIISWEYLKGDVKLAEKFCENGFSPREEILNLAIGNLSLNSEEKPKRKKPEAILIYAKRDPSQTFIEIPHLKFLKEISSNYDVSLSLCGNDKDVLKALDKIEKPELIIFAGHGNGNEMSLGDSLKLKDKIGEKIKDYSFDISDDKTIKKLQKKRDAICVFYNCLNGKSFAPKVKEKIPNLKIFAAKDTIYTKGYKINSMHPFDISFFNPSGNDCTYKK